jgi:predicted helicase
MSIQAIKDYQSEVEKIIHYGGTKKETSIRNAFYVLLNDYAKQKGFMLVPEVSVRGKMGRNVTPDGTIKDFFRQDWGYWESKDEADIIDDEIDKKFSKGYPDDNILFEDSNTAVLIQSGNEMLRVSMKDAKALDTIITAFINYERPEVKNFRDAIEHFKQDIPRVTEVLRNIINEQETKNKEFVTARDKFLELCKESINPSVVVADVTEMMIQHILTEDIFNVIFDETQFHRENNIARELEKVIHTFFTGDVRRSILAKIQHYFQTINTSAANIPDHHEKQKFLKVLYETFYKSYNPKAADRLGVVYTPNEIVRFMVESTDHLLNKHFGKFLEDKNVEILDPATGTGTFICEIIDRLRKDKVEYKYKNEIHANEVAILPYYIANLNIEFTYKQKTNEYAEFKNLCFVDTLDNMGFEFTGKQYDMFGVSAENVERIKRQNEKKISVVIGNPPYNANQMNENENNKNRDYPLIDKRIKNTFVKNSTAQKSKVYDMYARFYRWAMDRINENGIICFISNNSFINARTFDGFRKSVQEEFDFAYIIDTKSDVRANPKIAGTTHNVFGIQTGVAIMLLVKHDVPKSKDSRCSIQYFTMDDFWVKEKKLQWLAENKLNKIDFVHITPDKKNNWINLSDNDFESLIPTVSKETKLAKNDKIEKTIFKLFSIGVVTARDEWVYDYAEEQLQQKLQLLINAYNSDVDQFYGKINKTEIKNVVNYSIKWSRAVKKDLSNGIKYIFDREKIVDSLFRPYVNKNLYYAKELNEMQYQNSNLFGINANLSNKVIGFLSMASSHLLTVLASYKIIDAGLLKQGNGITQCFPLYRYDKNGNRIDNITDWGLEQFQTHFKSKKITKEDIFNYVYAVLHNPAYGKKYELNLKREFPRIPFYDDFFKWCKWGKKLMDLHINYETVNPYDLNIVTISPSVPLRTKKGNEKELFEPREHKIKAKLKANKDNGTIELDEVTTLTGIPKEVWEYKLGNRSALEWILDQYKEKKPSDPTIAEKFNTYRFADYKEQVIDLLKRVCTVSVETMKVVREMEGLFI